MCILIRIPAAFIVVAMFASIAAAPAQSSPQSTKEIRQTALDYIEGWYEGDGARMERALHPELAKRMVSTDPKTGRSVLDQMGAMTLVLNTRKGSGTRFPKSQQHKEITILDVYENAACVKIDAATWVDYLEMAKWNGQWKIINVLWELKPVPASSEPKQ